MAKLAIAPHAGARIETYPDELEPLIDQSHLTQVRGLKRCQARA